MKVNHPSLLIYPLAVIISTLAITVSSFSPPGRPHHHTTPFPSGSCNIITTTNDSTTSSTSTTRLYSSTKGKNGKTKFGQRTDSTEVSRYLTEFRTADGKVVDPYKLLQVKRNCSQADIKQSYRRLSKKLHPDMVARAEILPGRCTNLDEVRDEWERVKFSYEILSDPKTRKNYDRNSSVAEILEDPAAAAGRAVVGGAMNGVGMVLGGVWKLGEMALKK